MYINLLIQLKNAQAVNKENIKFPYSKNDLIIAEILTANKFIVVVGGWVQSESFN
ncbi:MAG: hypothetical protein UR88_C0018G0007 [Candidatus Nomurabacteria bacterium GW2011_GWA1_35_8]|uniref:Uncharacterized protein n=1 Tax=Candidatus Nomurabacteria bacterium GW2011_GWA1_35_8 TaxID=1618727 RepID=A0A0G0D9W3_9BACT|nr:MAG: hypothetical protein UR88_C0018G0007 [Candidatus Nomurabacteria bacterium GW2011_GWA1_35_8]